jgi:hypothetical protein
MIFFDPIINLVASPIIFSGLIAAVIAAFINSLFLYANKRREYRGEVGKLIADFLESNNEILLNVNIYKRVSKLSRKDKKLKGDQIPNALKITKFCAVRIGLVAPSKIVKQVDEITEQVLQLARIDNLDDLTDESLSIRIKNERLLKTTRKYLKSNTIRDRFIFFKKE